MRLPCPILLSDIGGTNARFALARDHDSQPRRLDPLRTSDFASFEVAMTAALAGVGVVPKSVMICAAGPVENTGVRLTNANWAINGTELAREFKLDQGLIFNDFEALALSIPAFKPEWLKTIGPAGKATDGPQLIHGPGTGLGSAALIRVEGKWRAIASEGSHSDFAPIYEDELRIWPHIERRMGRITPETLISGPGLRRLHRARIAAGGEYPPDIHEAEIIAHALADPRSQAGASVKLFLRLVARYAGDVALNFLATGGVYLAGGLLPRMLALLDEAEFRAAFSNKAPYERLAGKIPTKLLIEPDAVFSGMAAIARRPADYAIDYEARAWVQ